MEKQRWGYMLKRFCDQGSTLHLLKDDNSPACGAKFYAAAGASAQTDSGPKCQRCERIAEKRGGK